MGGHLSNSGGAREAKGFSLTAKANVMALAVLAALAAVLLASSTASAHYRSSDSVDANEQINYRNYTKYDDEVAHAQYWWNDLDTRYNNRGVRITVDTDGTTNDLDVGDYRDCSSSTNGKYVPRDGADVIYFNACNLDTDSLFDRKSTSTHEFGHALRLTHPPETEYYRENAIMYPCSQCTNYNTPRPHDDSDYYDLWIN